MVSDCDVCVHTFVCTYSCVVMLVIVIVVKSVVDVVNAINCGVCELQFML